MKSNPFVASILLSTTSLFLLSCSPKTRIVEATESATPKPAVPKNIILMIGDGMGLSQVSTAFFYQQDHLSHFPRFKHIGLINTSSASHKITDSAAGATAFASGIKTYNNAVGMNSDTLPAGNIVEILSQGRNMRTGLVATSSITHATPAAFYAHVAHRRQEMEIAKFMAKSGVDFFAGGGKKFFRTEWNNLMSNGFVVDTTALPKGPYAWDYTKKYGFLAAENGMPSIQNGRGNFLQEASEHAISYLSGSGNPFFLMIEGSQIDWGGHNNDYHYLATEVLDFDRTIGKVLDFAEKDGNTLVIVLADHETGGFTLAGAPIEGEKMDGDYNDLRGLFSTGGHSAALIPVFAFGPGAEQFQGIYQNNDVFHKMLKLLGIE